MLKIKWSNNNRNNENQTPFTKSRHNRNHKVDFTKQIKPDPFVDWSRLPPVLEAKNECKQKIGTNNAANRSTNKKHRRGVAGKNSFEKSKNWVKHTHTIILRPFVKQLFQLTHWPSRPFHQLLYLLKTYIEIFYGLEYWGIEWKTNGRHKWAGLVVKMRKYDEK